MGSVDNSLHPCPSGPPWTGNFRKIDRDHSWWRHPRAIVLGWDAVDTSGWHHASAEGRDEIHDGCDQKRRVQKVSHGQCWSDYPLGPWHPLIKWRTPYRVVKCIWTIRDGAPSNPRNQVPKRYTHQGIKQTPDYKPRDPLCAKTWHTTYSGTEMEWTGKKNSESILFITWWNDTGLVGKNITPLSRDWWIGSGLVEKQHTIITGHGCIRKGVVEVRFIWWGELTWSVKPHNQLSCLLDANDVEPLLRRMMNKKQKN